MKFLLLFVVYLVIATPTFAQQATLSISPSSGTVNRSCAFTADVVLNTGGAQTDGTDAIILYDTSRFTATSISNGTIYPDYPGNNIDDVAGKITISGLASVTSAFSGSGTLATISMAVKDNAPTGASQIKFDFDPNDKTKTTDSNVVQRGTVADILNSVVNGSFTVGTGTCNQQTVASTTGGSTGTGTSGSLGKGGLDSSDSGQFKSLPPAGLPELTATIAIIGGVLTILGILGLALL